MAGRSRKKAVVIALLFAVAVGIFLPPRINGRRFSKQLASTLSAALGREVKIGQVAFRLFPRPGFDLYDFRVMDNPAFSAEPLLQCGEVAADLRLTSLWEGRLEIANLSLKNNDSSPPSLNLVYVNGHWNLESLLLRAGQVPAAPTSKPRAEQRPRFPYIEASAGRINLKIGPEKKPYALTNTDFAFWLPQEDRWHFRLEGHPMRTDMNLSDAGAIKVEGDIKRSQDLRDLPIQVQAQWQKAQLGQVSSLIFGQDKGWRGALELNVRVSGSPADLHFSADGDLQNLRRYDNKRNEMPRLTPRCVGEFNGGGLAWGCNLALGDGEVRFASKTLPGTQDRTCSLTAQHLQLATLTTFARHVYRALPDDLTATGELNADFSCESAPGSLPKWRGSGSTSAFVLQSSAAVKPFLVSAVAFHFAEPETPSTGKKRPGAKVIAPSVVASLKIDPFSLQLGTSATLQAAGQGDRSGYQLQVKGLAPIERTLELGRTFGLPSRFTNTTGVATLDLTIAGAWSSFDPPRLEGHARLQNLTAWVPGLKEPVLISSADAQSTDTALVLSNVVGRLGTSPIAFTGSTSHGWNCQGEISCPVQFDLHADALNIKDAAILLGIGQPSEWKIPFFSGASKSLPDFRAKGTVAIRTLKLGELPAEDFAAHVEVGDHLLAVNNIAARVAGGTATGDWKIDWKTSIPRSTGSGAFASVTVDRLATAGPHMSLLSSWISGQASLKYTLRLEGRTAAELFGSAIGAAEMTATDGTSRALALEPGKPVRFQTFESKLELDRRILQVLPSKLQAENRIYTISGTISLADKQAKLKVGNSVAEWDITGALEKPQVAAHTLAAQAGSAHTK